MYYCIKCYERQIHIRVSQPNMWMYHCQNCGALGLYDIIVLVPIMRYTPGLFPKKLSIQYEVLNLRKRLSPPEETFWPSWRPDELGWSPEISEEKLWLPDLTDDTTVYGGCEIPSDMINFGLRKDND